MRQEQLSTPSSEREKQYLQVAEGFVGQAGITGPLDQAPAKRAFGATALKFNGKIFALLNQHQDFVVKLPAARVDALLAIGAGMRFDPGHGRLMKEWLVVRSADLDDWQNLAREALDFAQQKTK